MKYSVPYNRDFKYLKEVDEISITYTTEQADYLIGFLEEQVAEDQRVSVVDYSPENDWEQNLVTFKMAYETHPNIVIMLPTPDHCLMDLLMKEKIPFAFTMPCVTRSMVAAMVDMGVSDVFVAEDLGFDIIDVGRYCHSNGVRVRVYPNILQKKWALWNKEYDICSFFIRPEDTEKYEPYVDIFDLYYTLDDRLSVTYEIYKQQEYDGDLKDLIVGMEHRCINRNILTTFAQSRLDCKKRCSCGGCRYCTELRGLANVMEDKGLYIREDPDERYII